MVRGDAAEQVRAVGRALEAGIRYFDTAPSYGDGRSEENLGRALAGLEAGRHALIGTKVWLGDDDLDRPAVAVRRSPGTSLRRPGRDRGGPVPPDHPVPQGEAGALTADLKRHPNASRVEGSLAGGGYAEDVARSAALARIASEEGPESGLELGLRFALTSPGVSVVGLSSIEHLDAALRWERRGPLDQRVVTRVVQLARAA